MDIDYEVEKHFRPEAVALRRKLAVFVEENRVATGLPPRGLDAYEMSKDELRHHLSVLATRWGI